MRTLIVISFCFLLKLNIGYAQQHVKGKITDQNGKPVDLVTIWVADSQKGTMTTGDGTYSMPVAPGTYAIVFSKIGFISEEKKVEIFAEDVTVDIQLQEDTTNLGEVVISASREQQRRSEVPGAISVLDANTIKNTKALGIDQLVNQVPGVFMSTSRVASNEQHFMAVRSPISTRALFLYLEDGLQIRPTSVFNHNALLEMNDVAYKRVEVLKGPASSIYGSEAIGGSFNFITKSPTEKLEASVAAQGNNLGLTRYEFEVSDQTSTNFGFYLGTQHVERNEGPVGHSDYEKSAVTFKTVCDIMPTLRWTAVADIVDYRSDMTGSLSENDYLSENYESDQTFTERDALAFRIRNTLDMRWNSTNKTAFNLIYRDNRMDQNPSFRIRQFREQGQLTGSGSGEVNSNQFRSYVALVQHKKDFSFLKSSLIAGGTVDVSPQDYVAERTNVTVDTETQRNVSFDIQTGDFILNYTADIINYAGFFQYEASPVEDVKITAALRYDRFEYDYENRIDRGVVTANDSYDNIAPKVGVNYNFGVGKGVYANYSQGFTPPQVSTLYRNRFELRDIKPSVYTNYEVGTYLVLNEKLRLDGAVYLLDGRNTLITLRNDADEFFNTNAGQTQSYGIEYGVRYSPVEKLQIAHNGSYAKHRYITFFDGNARDFSNTDRETAPSLLGTTTLTYTFSPDFTVSAEHELVGRYNTSLEGQLEDGSTAEYAGHNVFNLRARYRYKRYEVWAHALNIFDTLYSARASYNRFRSENSYIVGNPFGVHVGAKIYL